MVESPVPAPEGSSTTSVQCDNTWTKKCKQNKQQSACNHDCCKWTQKKGRCKTNGSSNACKKRQLKKCRKKKNQNDCTKCCNSVWKDGGGQCRKAKNRSRRLKEDILV